MIRTRTSGKRAFTNVQQTFKGDVHERLANVREVHSRERSRASWKGWN